MLHVPVLALLLTDADTAAAFREAMPAEAAVPTVAEDVFAIMPGVYATFSQENIALAMLQLLRRSDWPGVDPRPTMQASV